MKYIKAFAIGAFASIFMPQISAETIELQELPGTEYITCLSSAAVRINKSTDGNPLTIEGTVYDRGIGTHAPSVIIVKLNGATSFSGIVGVDDEAIIKADHGVVDYVITGYGDSKDAATELAAGNLDRQPPSQTWHADLNFADLSGYQYLKFDFQTGTKNWADHVDVVNAVFTYTGEAPVIVAESMMYTTTVPLPETPSIDGAQIIPLASLQIENITNGWKNPVANKSIDNNPLTMKGKVYTSGVGIHAPAKVVVKLNGTTPKFHCELGIDDEVASTCLNDNVKSTVDYMVILRDLSGKETLSCSGTINSNDPSAVTIDLDGLTDYKYLILNFSAGQNNDSDHIDLANAYFEFVYNNSSEPEIVPESQLVASLNAATTLFSQPGVRFMHKLRALDPAAKISVANLPAGLTFNEARCLVEGVVDIEGEYNYEVTVTTDDDEQTTPVTLTVSSSLQQPTPFMGWLSWNSIEGNISASIIESVADQMVSKGLLDAGYNYLVIDDLWHASARAADGAPVEAPAKFPDGMKASADYVHSKGLKFGIYSDAAERTCAYAYGSLGYETNDANQYAKWEVDLLKYDYCGAPSDVETAKIRYKAMGDALKASGRDILFYICEWGVREPWKWGAEAGGTCWRASYDTRDCWVGKNANGTVGIGIVQSIRDMKDIWMYNGVNRWNDADMMMIGLHGTGRSSSQCCQTGPGMTMDEYRTQMALWCMWQSPLTLSNDMSKAISDEDLAIITNQELIAINQDRMGQAAETIYHDAADCLMLAKDCENGDVVVSVTNLGDAPKAFTLDLAKVSAANPGATYLCRDVVNHKDCGKVTATVDFGTVPSHATVVYRLSNEIESGIHGAAAAEALGEMTVAVVDNAVRVCLPGTHGAAKRVLLSDVEGRVVAEACGTDECFEFAAPGNKGVYFVNTICAARSRTAKLAI